MAAGRKTGGRKKGTPNKKSVKQLEDIAASGLTPLQFLLSELRDENLSHDIRHNAAVAAAPYVHSKMPTAIVSPPPPSGPVTSDDETLLDRYLNGLHAEADES